MFRMPHSSVARRRPARTDPRVRRTRAALMAAAVGVVSERRTTDVPVSDLVAVADTSRRVLYQHFENRDELLVAAGLDLLTRSVGDLFESGELRPHPESIAVSPMSMGAVAEHLAEHHYFYRALLTGSCAYRAHEAVCTVFRPASVAAARAQFGASEQSQREVADYFTDATTTAATRWLVESGDHAPNPTQFIERLMRIQSVIATSNTTVSAKG